MQCVISTECLLMITAFISLIRPAYVTLIKIIKKVLLFFCLDKDECHGIRFKFFFFYKWNV